MIGNKERDEEIGCTSIQHSCGETRRERLRARALVHCQPNCVCMQPWLRYALVTLQPSLCGQRQREAGATASLLGQDRQTIVSVGPRRGDTEGNYTTSGRTTSGFWSG